MKHVTMYTDGSCLGNPGPGGYAAILHYQDNRGAEHERIICGSAEHTTNNQMELMAVIEGLRALKSPCCVDIYTDSNYVRQGITAWIFQWKRNGWKTAGRKPVANRELWEELDSLITQHQIQWHWVKGHSGHEMNERCDDIARQQAQQMKDQM